MESEKTVEQKIIDRILSAYKKRPAKIAKACDEILDRSGNLLGWIRELDRHPRGE